MAAKMAKAAPLNGMHTAGIYSDMTADGPDIGTLVIIVDRAKNLPNRKSIGKQDPYCAARLGKEAKKTETDRRGGQTPKWDQELRFTVHDSPDYYQLKVSIFNDDRKTDLIGETWVSLQEVIVPGGGQNDLWHNLNYRGKYAGEIRIEMTYYDSRPKQEKVSEKTRQTAPTAVVDSSRDLMTGPRQPKPAVKRRPLPSDPTGASPSPAAAPEHTQTPSRGYQTSPAYIHTQSPLQAVEFNTPHKHSHSQQEHGSNRPGMIAYSTPPGMIAVTPVGLPMPDDRYQIYDPMGDREINQVPHRSPYDSHMEEERRDLQYRYSPQESPAELPVPNEYNSPPSPGGPPPPPPAHRSNHASPAYSMPPQNGHSDASPLNSIRTVPHEAPQIDHYRNTMGANGQGNSYMPYSPTKPQELQSSYPGHNQHQETTPRQHSYEGRRDDNYRSMQPTVEDEPSSPAAPYPPHRSSDPRLPHHDDRRYDQVPPTAPLNLSGRGSAASGNYSTSGTSSQQFYNGPSSSASPVSYRESLMDSEVSSQTSYSQLSHQSQKDRYQRQQSDDLAVGSPNSYVPSLPPTLVAGMDPVIAQEVSERIYTENRASYSQDSSSLRNRYSQQPQYRHSYPHPYQQQEASVPFVPATISSAPFMPGTAAYDGRQGQIPAATHTPIVKPRAISPDPRVPARKSISPAPAQPTEDRRLSGIPFGPDAYDALNTNLSSSPSAGQQLLIAKFDSPVMPGQHDDSNPGAKIIMHDGREVDPSDHLPEASWAPEPESRGVKQLENGRGRPMSGAQLGSSAGPRPIRQAGRPVSMAAPPSSPMHPAGSYSDPSSPVIASGRTRLQKKPNRNYIAPALQSSSLASGSVYQDDAFAGRGLPRAQTMDFGGENRHASQNSSRNGYYDAHGHGRNSIGGPPPVPAKVPIRHGPAPPPPTENAWALLEEMKSIDLGSGRARRRGHAAA